MCNGVSQGLLEIKSVIDSHITIGSHMKEKRVCFLHFCIYTPVLSLDQKNYKKIFTSYCRLND